jgi:cyclopropane-fatty-acyl-phospholipid synthase
MNESFDVVFAIGVFEHIHNLDLAFERIAEMLKPGGRCFLHLIVSIPEIPEYQDSKTTLIGKYFPGGRVWPFQVFRKLEAHMHLEASWYINGTNYWKTLDEWHKRFWQKVPELAEGLLTQEEIRHWNDYFTLCKVVLFGPLGGKVYGNGHYLFRKPD